MLALLTPYGSQPIGHSRFAPVIEEHKKIRKPEQSRKLELVRTLNSGLALPYVRGRGGAP